MKPSFISFVIIEYHSVDDIKGCVKSIQDRCKSTPYEIIVSSNSCYPKEKCDKLECDMPEVRWSFNKRNGGFAYAMNRGMEIAAGDYLAIINPDVRIVHGLDAMVRFMETNPMVGAIAPQIVNSKGIIQDSARPYVSVPRYVWRCIKRVAGHKSSVLTRKMDYSQVQTVDWVIGAFIMARREVYEMTRGMDDAYFMYAEDLDWCTRIRACGYEIVYYPLAKINYEGSRSARKSQKYARIFLRSHCYYWKKFGFFYGYPRRKPLEMIDKKRWKRFTE